MPDEFMALTGCHRKHAVRLLSRCEQATGHTTPRGQRIDAEAVSCDWS